MRHGRCLIGEQFVRLPAFGESARTSIRSAMAFLAPDPARQPIFRAPAVVIWLIGGLVAAHAARVFQPQARADALVFQFGFYPARYSRAFMESHMANPGTVWEQAVPFVSYMAVHADWMHLIVNCFWLLAFGPVVARRFGTPLFLLFFIVCGLGAVLTHLALNWGSEMPVIGASGAISGLMAAALRMMPGQTPWAAPGQAPLLPIWSRQLLIFSAVWVAINLVTGLTGFAPGAEGLAVAWQAHLGGFAAGLLLCGVFDRLRPRVTGLPLDR
jgi:membrane associated rhomboid family serine protease